MEDDNQDEADGLDEALIPYDASLSYQEGIYEGNNHLRDDEIEKHLVCIRQKLGENGSLLVTFDACHSGTGTRKLGEANIRGTSAKFLLTETTKAQYTPQQEHWLHLSACMDGECNRQFIHDGKAYGSLTYTLYLLQNRLRSSSAKELIKLIETQLNKLVRRPQTPQLEGSEACKKATIL